jgi:toxin-antitoxin system, antitoxin component, xre family
MPYAPSKVKVNKVTKAINDYIDLPFGFDKAFTLLYRNFGGALFETKDEDGNDCVVIRFNSLMLMRFWYERYEKYEEEVRRADEIKNVNERKAALERAYQDFDLLMDIYPVSESFPERVEAQKSMTYSWTRSDSIRRIWIDNSLITDLYPKCTQRT